MDWKELYGKVDWKYCNNQSGKILLVEIDDHNATASTELDEDVYSRDELLRVNSFVTYNINQYNDLNRFITKYEIIERVIDVKNNLILFVKKQTLDF